MLDGTQPLPKKGAERPCLLWPNGWVDQGGTWHGGRPWSRPHCARWGRHPAPLHKMGTELPPKFSASFYCGQTAGCIKMPLGMEAASLSPGDFVFDGDPAAFPKKGTEPPPQFSAHFYCGQTAGCIKMPLGMEVDLSPGDCVRWDPAPPQKGGGAPMSIVAKRLG